MSIVMNIENETKNNNNFRKVLYSAPHSQLVIMSIKAGEDIGEEVHDVDQFIRVEMGEGKAILNSTDYEIQSDWAMVIPAGTTHNVINTGISHMKLYTVYSPPQHPDGTIHVTKSEAMKAEEQ